MTDTALYDLHCDLAALVNPQCHFNLCGMPDVERRAMRADIEQEITEAVMFEQHWGEIIAKILENV